MSKCYAEIENAFLAVCIISGSRQAGISTSTGKGCRKVRRGERKDCGQGREIIVYGKGKRGWV